MSSSPLALSVQDLGKNYRIVKTHRPRTLGEAIAQRVRRPFAKTPLEDFAALANVSLDVSKGEAVGIIGRNGAGKSTLLKIISRIMGPSAGRIEVYGQVGSLLEVGTGFHPELTGRENIFLNGAILGMRKSEVEREFDSIVEFAGVEQFLDTPTKRYSSGMSVRLAFAVAAHLNAEILIVDEVLAVGDTRFQQKCLGRMSQVTQELGRTVLFVSHNLAAVESFCRRSVVLDRGKVIFDGPTSEAISVYMSASGPQPDEACAGHFDLRAAVRPQSVGGGLLRSLSVRGPDGRPTDLVRMSEPMSLAIALGDVSLPEHIVGVAIRTDVGAPVAGVNTAILPPAVAPSSRGPTDVILHIPKLPFLPGRYWIDVAVWRFGDQGNLDRVENAGSFHVENADVYGAGRGLAGGGHYGVVYLDGARWDITARTRPAGQSE